VTRTELKVTRTFIWGLSDPNATMTVIVQYADMNDASPAYLARPSAASEPVNLLRLPLYAHPSPDAIWGGKRDGSN